MIRHSYYVIIGALIATALIIFSIVLAHDNEEDPRVDGALIATALIIFSIVLAHDNARIAELQTCYDAAEKFSVETGWEPDGGIEAWCAVNVD